MNDILSIIGSIASIGSIPLAIYLYLRNREARFLRLRQDIKQVVSYQIGEGRSLAAFEIQAIIDSKTRDARAKDGTVKVSQVVEDLVADTIASPMLDGKRKEEIVENLRRIHSEMGIVRILDEHPIGAAQLLEAIASSSEADNPDLQQLRDQIAAEQERPFEVEPATPLDLSRKWATAATVTAGGAALASILAEGAKILPEAIDTLSRFDYGVLLSALVSVAAGVVMALWARASTRRK